MNIIYSLTLFTEYTHIIYRFVISGAHYTKHRI